MDSLADRLPLHHEKDCAKGQWLNPDDESVGKAECDCFARKFEDEVRALEAERDELKLWREGAIHFAPKLNEMVTAVSVLNKDVDGD